MASSGQIKRTTHGSQKRGANIGRGGARSGASNGLNADGSLMNLGNVLAEKPSVSLQMHLHSGGAMASLLGNARPDHRDVHNRPTMLSVTTEEDGGGGASSAESVLSTKRSRAADGSSRPSPTGSAGAGGGELRRSPRRAPAAAAAAAAAAAGAVARPASGSSEEAALTSTLHAAIRLNKRFVVRNTVEQDGGSVNAKAADGSTALHLAASMGRTG